MRIAFVSISRFACAIEAQRQPVLARRPLIVGDAEIETVISNMDKPSDVYVVLRLGEMSHKPTDVVLEKTKLNKGKGWGVIAKSLGIKPGSSEFHALKRSQDLYNVNVDKKSKSKGKSKSKK